MAETAAVTLLRPVRVLVAGDDTEIVAHLRDELLRTGFHAMSTGRLSRVTELAAVERVNVVILEVSGGLSAAASTAAAVEALPQPIRVLLAGARIRGGVRLGYDTVDPHGSSEELVAAVHRAYRGGPLRAERLS
jgi:DNA-binding response OmpR family regulator